MNQKIDGFSLREYLNLPSIQKEQMDWDYFDALHQVYATTRNKSEKDECFEIMLRLLMHFFTKTAMSYQDSLGAAVDLEDMDAVIAETFYRCCVRFDDGKNSSFGNYVKASIKRQLWKEFRHSLPVHVNARDKMPRRDDEECPIKTVAILSEEEALENGVSSAAVNFIDAEVTKALAPNYSTYLTDVASAIEAREYSDKLFRRVLSVENGDQLLAVCGISYDKANDMFLYGPKKTRDRVALECGQKKNAVAYQIKKACAAIRELYPELLEEWVA